MSLTKENFRRLPQPDRLHLETVQRKVRVAATWRVEDCGIAGHTMLRLHHPGLGWVTFLLPDADAKELAEQLVANSDRL